MTVGESQTRGSQRLLSVPSSIEFQLTFSDVSSSSPLLPKLTSSPAGEGLCEGAVRAGGGEERDVEGSSTDVRPVAT